MKRLFTSLLFITIALAATDWAGGRVMRWVNQNTNDITGPKLRYMTEGISEDVVMLGASRCSRHYVPSILSDSLEMSVYNAGIDASENIYSHYIALNLILSRHTPKMICLELMSDDYSRRPHSFAPTSFFAPYIGTSNAADSIFMEAGSYWPYILCHLYRYNAKAISNIGGLFINKQQGNDHGYLPIPQPAVSPNKLNTAHTIHDIDTLKLHYLRRFIHQCQSRHIKLVFTVSPLYTHAEADYYDVLKNVARDHNIPFFDYHSQGLYTDHPEYFKDYLHLWDKGACQFSSIFAHDLKRHLSSHKHTTNDICIRHCGPAPGQ